MVDFRRQGDDHPSEERPGRRGRADLVLLVPPPKTMPVGTVEAVHKPGNKLLGKSTRSSRQREAGEWIERQLLSAPCLTEDRWQRIARILHRQTTSMRSGEKRPPLTGRGIDDHRSEYGLDDRPPLIDIEARPQLVEICRAIRSNRTLSQELRLFRSEVTGSVFELLYGRKDNFLREFALGRHGHQLRDPARGLGEFAIP